MPVILAPGESDSIFDFHRYLQARGTHASRLTFIYINKINLLKSWELWYNCSLSPNVTLMSHKYSCFYEIILTSKIIYYTDPKMNIIQF